METEKEKVKKQNKNWKLNIRANKAANKTKFKTNKIKTGNCKLEQMKMKNKTKN